MNVNLRYVVSITALSALFSSSVFAQNYVFREPLQGVKANPSYNIPTNPGYEEGDGNNQIIDDYLSETEVEFTDESTEQDIAVGGIVVAIRYYDQENYNTQEITDLYNNLSTSDPDSFATLTNYMINNDIEYKVIHSGSVVVSPLNYPSHITGGKGDSYLDENMGYIDTSWGTMNFGMGITYHSFDSDRTPKYRGTVNVGQVTAWDGLSGNIYNISNGASIERQLIGGEYSVGFNGFNNTVHYFNFVTVRCYC
jgi:hypothetical protein